MFSGFGVGLGFGSERSVSVGFGSLEAEAAAAGAEAAAAAAVVVLPQTAGFSPPEILNCAFGVPVLDTRCASRLLPSQRRHPRAV